MMYCSSIAYLFIVLLGIVSVKGQNFDAWLYNSTCRPLDLSLMPTCANELSVHGDILVTADFNETLTNSVVNYLLGDTVECPYYTKLQYLCEVFTMRCENDTATLEAVSAGPDDILLVGACRDICLEGRDYELCGDYGDSYFTTFCSDNDFYSDEPYCYVFDYGVAEKETDEIWIYILASFLGLIGLAILSNVAYGYWKKQRFNPSASEANNEPWQFEKDDRTAREAAVKKQQQKNEFQPLEDGIEFNDLRAPESAAVHVA